MKVSSIGTKSGIAVNICKSFIFLLLLSSTCSAQSLSWRDISNGLTDLDIHSISVHSKETQRLLCSSPSTIYVSSDSGLTWEIALHFRSQKEPDQTYLSTLSETDDESDQFLKRKSKKRISPRRDIGEETEITIEVEDEFDSFSVDDLDEEELIQDGILEEEERLEDLDDAEVLERMNEAGLVDVADEAEEDAELAFEEPKRATIYNTIRQVCWDPVNAPYAYAATQRGLFRSIDFGRTWESVGVDLTNASANIESLTVTSPSGYVVVATHEGIYYSSDLGVNFLPVPDAPLNSVYMDITFDPHQPNGFSTITNGIVFSGSPTGPIARPLPSAFSDIHIFSSIPLGANGWIVASDSTIYRIASSGQWISTTSVDLRSAKIFSILAIDGLVYAATNRGVLSWDPETSQIRFLNEALPDLNVRTLASAPFKPFRLFAGARTGAYVLAHSDDKIYQTPVLLTRIKMKDATFPQYSEILHAAINYAEIDVSKDRRQIAQADLTGWLPEIQVRYFREFDEDFGYGKDSSIFISNQNIYLTVDDQEWLKLDSDHYRFEFKLKWFPNVILASKSRLSALRLLNSEIKRRQQVINHMERLYYDYASRLSDLGGFGSGEIDILKRVELEQLRARLNAMSGFYLDELESNSKPHE